MNRDALLPLKGKHVQVRKIDGFMLDGELLEVWDDAISILADHKLRIIRLDQMVEVREYRRG
jgi:hypothetical protein